MNRVRSKMPPFDERAWPCGCHVSWTLILCPPAMLPIWCSKVTKCADHATSKAPKEEK